LSKLDLEAPVVDLLYIFTHRWSTQLVPSEFVEGFKKSSRMLSGTDVAVSDVGAAGARLSPATTIVAISDLSLTPRF
jgi:hypothetical protein